MLKKYFPAALIIMAAAATISAQVKVSETYSFDLDKADSQRAGEAQSTVIAPGLKAECPNGCFIASRDGLRAPANGAIVSRELNKPSAAPRLANFTMHPTWQRNPDCATKAGDYTVGTDHDLVTLANGDVLYIAAVCLKTPITPEPVWFKQTYRQQFGPGARSGVMIWRSQNGGQTFNYLSVIDSAAFENGVPGYPQFRSYGTDTDSSPYDMGGSDGPLATVDPASGTIYLSTWVVGSYPETGKTNPFVLSKNRVNKTVLFSSTNGGASWSSVGMMDGGVWRQGILPVGSDSVKKSLLLAGMIVDTAENVVITAEKTAPLRYSETESKQIPLPNIYFGWESWYGIKRDDKGKPVLDKFKQTIPVGNWSTLAKYVSANVWANTVISRVPGSKDSAVIAAPDTIVNKGNGYRVYFYNYQTGDLYEGDNVFPQNKSDQSAAMHLTVADSGGGSVLLYWYDLNHETLQGKIRGRIILGDKKESGDFDISEPFDLKQAERFWYGDYHTAKGYFRKTPPPALRMFSSSYFYPMWVQPDKTIRYARVMHTAEKGDNEDSLKPNLRLPPLVWEEKQLPPNRRLQIAPRGIPGSVNTKPRQVQTLEPQNAKPGQ